MGFHVELNTILRSDEPATVDVGQSYEFKRSGSRVFFDDIPIWLTRMNWTAVAEIKITNQSRTAKEVRGTFEVLRKYVDLEQSMLTEVFRRMYSFPGEDDPYFYLLESVEILESAMKLGYLFRDDLRKDGFIHASPADQLTRVANKYYRNAGKLRCAAVAKKRVVSPVKYEPATGGVYPHIYGPLNMNAIDMVVEIKPGADGVYDIDVTKFLNDASSADTHLVKMVPSGLEAEDMPKASLKSHGNVGFQKIMTLLRKSDGFEAADGTTPVWALDTVRRAAERAIPDPQRRTVLLLRLAEAMQELEESDAESGPEVMSSPQHRLAALMQSRLGGEPRPPSSDGLEFDFGPSDIEKVMAQVFADYAHTPDHAILRPESDVPTPLPNVARIAVFGDFGTGLYGAPVTAQTIADDPRHFDLLLHLGDVYYAGTPAETQARLIDIWPQRTDAPLSRTLNGNHDMYSGGYGYFDLALPKFKQSSSYFAMQNDCWLLLFLDTAHTDKSLDEEQIAWIGRTIATAGERKIVFFSHHPLFSNFKKPGTELAAALAEVVLVPRRLCAWYWGHEHHCVIYDRDPQHGFWGCCLGHGGMPWKRKDLSDYDIESEVGTFSWRRIKAGATPTALILDGPNPYIEHNPEKYGPHGYAVLELTDGKLLETIHAPDGQVLYQRELS